MLILVIIIIVIVGLVMMVKAGGRRQERDRREKYKIPTDASVLNYLGGHAQMKAGTVYAMSENAELILVSRESGERIAIPFGEISGVELNSDIQTYSTGGGRSVGGAVVGDIIAGPLGAIVGGSKKSKVKTEDRSTVLLRTKNQRGMEFAIIFKGGQYVYNNITKLLA